ncbi:MAG: hypothetical protein RL291_1824, partial [Pseudomonadota bacterium]
MKRAMKTAFVLAVGALIATGAAVANDVTLKMKGGAFEVSGALRAFDGQKYVIETKDFGNLTLDADRFECVGEACQQRGRLPATPQDQIVPGKADEITIRGNEYFVQTLVPGLIDGFAQKLGGTVTAALMATTAGSRLEITNAEGQDLVNFDIQRDTTASAIAALIEGKQHFVISDRSLTTDEIQKLTAGNTRLRARDLEHLVAVDVLAVVAHPSLPVDALTIDALQRVLSGSVKDWSELGLPKGPITLHGRSGGAADAFAEQALKPRNLSLSAAMVASRSEGDVAAAVARDPFAIGITSLAAAQGVKPLGLDTACGIIHRPSSFAVKSGFYPFARRVYVLTSGAALPAAARGLLRHIQSADVEPITEAKGFGGRTPEAMLQREAVRRMAEITSAPQKAFDLRLINELQAELKTARPLSVVIRFLPGGNELDPRSRNELAWLAERLAEPALAQKTIVLAGFANAGGPIDQATAAALKRAALVRVALLQALGQARGNQRQIIAKGFGHI